MFKFFLLYIIYNLYVCFFFFVHILSKNGRRSWFGLKWSKNPRNWRKRNICVCNLTNSKKWNEFRRSVINPFEIHLILWALQWVNVCVCMCAQHLRVHDSIDFEYGYIFFHIIITWLLININPFPSRCSLQIFVLSRFNLWLIFIRQTFFSHSLEKKM